MAGKVNIDKKSLQKGNMAWKPNNAMRIPKAAAKKQQQGRDLGENKKRENTTFHPVVGGKKRSWVC